MNDNKDVSITFRTTKKMKSQLDTMAKKESRTLSNMIEVLLQKGLDKSK